MNFWFGFALAAMIVVAAALKVLWKMGVVVQCDDERFIVRRLLGPKKVIQWSSVGPTTWHRTAPNVEFGIKYADERGAQSYIWVIGIPTKAFRRFEQVLLRRTAIEKT